MKKAAKDFKKGDIFKRFGNWHTIEETWNEGNKKITFKYPLNNEIANYATYMKNTLVETR